MGTPGAEKRRVQGKLLCRSSVGGADTSPFAATTKAMWRIINMWKQPNMFLELKFRTFIFLKKQPLSYFVCVKRKSERLCS